MAKPVELEGRRAPRGFWFAGPVPAASGVVVSVTDFTVGRRRDLPGIGVRGLRLAAGWYAMEGAVGLWLWSLPRERRSGSITVWTDERHLRRFVGLPVHTAIMRRYRERGALRSTTWTADGFARGDILTQAGAWIGEAA